jgi:hypothetical protein
MGCRRISKALMFLDAGPHKRPECYLESLTVVHFIPLIIIEVFYGLY